MAGYNIKIGPEFFAKAKNEYSNWQFAICREFAQNSIDSKCNTIDVTINTNEDGNTVMIVANDGAIMTKEILCDKLLTLGGSGKNFDDGSIGGFGQAKHILYLCHKSYKIETGNLCVTGQGGEYDLNENSPHFNGTRSTIVLDGDHTGVLIKMFNKVITLSQWGGVYNMNGQAVEDRLKKGSRRKDLTFGVIYTNKSHSHILVARIGGVVMFTRYASYEGCVVVEMTGKSGDLLQSSRDGLKWMYQDEIDTLIMQLSTNKRAALKDTRTTTEWSKFTGYKLKGKPKLVSTPDGSGTIRAGGNTYDAHSPQGQVVVALTSMVSSGQAQANRGQTVVIKDMPFRPEFVIKNETGLKIPEYYTPDKFSSYAKGLVWRWTGILVTLADIYGYSKPFAVGFIFTDEPTEAQFESTTENGRVIYIKPATVVRAEGKAPVLKAKWSLTGNVIWDLVSDAAHEFVHHLGYINHDEDYSSKLTDVLATCLKERGRLAKVFQSRVEWPDVEKE